MGVPWCPRPTGTATKEWLAKKGRPSLVPQACGQMTSWSEALGLSSVVLHKLCAWKMGMISASLPPRGRNSVRSTEASRKCNLCASYQTMYNLVNERKQQESGLR